MYGMVQTVFGCYFFSLDVKAAELTASTYPHCKFPNYASNSLMVISLAISLRTRTVHEYDSRTKRFGHIHRFINKTWSFLAYKQISYLLHFQVWSTSWSVMPWWCAEASRKSNRYLTAVNVDEASGVRITENRSSTYCCRVHWIKDIKSKNNWLTFDNVIVQWELGWKLRCHWGNEVTW